MFINSDAYINLISDFLSKKITGKCFEYAYLKLFTEEKSKRSEQEFPTLNTLFFDVDEFCSIPELIDEHDIDEDELRRRCKIAFDKLKKARTELFNQHKKIKINLESYTWLIDCFLSGKISKKCFEYVYIKTFTEEVGIVTEEEHAILDDLFVDSINVDDEIKLRKHCKIAIEKLKMLY